MEDLIDIQGLDHIGIWPLAIGWWVLLGAGIIGICAIGYYWYWKMQYHKSWQHAAYNRLGRLQKQLDHALSKDILQNLSIELRKIGMNTSKREICASLVGQQWLEWLQAHDPAGFNWADHGRILTEVQYMPDANTVTTNQISALINAAKVWVRKC